MESESLMTEEILEIKNDLETITEEHDLIERLKKLESSTITCDQLEETKIAKTVNRIKKQNKSLST